MSNNVKNHPCPLATSFTPKYFGTSKKMLDCKLKVSWNTFIFKSVNHHIKVPLNLFRFVLTLSPINVWRIDSNYDMKYALILKTIWDFCVLLRIRILKKLIGLNLELNLVFYSGLQLPNQKNISSQPPHHQSDTNTDTLFSSDKEKRHLTKEGVCRLSTIISLTPKGASADIDRDFDNWKNTFSSFTSSNFTLRYYNRKVSFYFEAYKIHPFCHISFGCERFGIPFEIMSILLL